MNSYYIYSTHIDNHLWASDSGQIRAYAVICPSRAAYLNKGRRTLTTYPPRLTCQDPQINDK